MGELKLCPNPWCGYDVMLMNEGLNCFYVSCDNCGLEAEGAPTQEEADAAWNNRPSERTSGEEAVIRAAVAMREATEGKRDRPMREYQEALLNLADALLAAQPEWKP